MAEDLAFDPTMTKKKKKKKVGALDLDDAATAADAPKAAKQNEDKDDAAVAEEVGLSEDFTGKKKKKKRKPVGVEDETAPDGSEMVDGTEPGGSVEPDYTYDELLSRVFNIMLEKNPDMISGEKKKFVMKPPQAARVGTKKTAFVNFAEICRLLKRQPKHLLAFLLAELGTSGSLDGNNQLIIKGKFNQKQLENVLRKYIKEYVTCHTCKSADTLLQKDTRLFFLQCETCGSRCSVTSIKSGFQAITTKRAQTRRAAAQ